MKCDEDDQAEIKQAACTALELSFTLLCRAADARTNFGQSMALIEEAEFWQDAAITLLAIPKPNELN